MIRAILSLALGLMVFLAASLGQAAGLDFQTYDQGLKKAADEKKMIMIFFWAEWCKYCTQIRREVFQNDQVQEAFEKSFVAVSVDIQNDPDQLAKKYRASVLPTLTFLSPEGEPLAYWEGATDPDTFLKILDHVTKGE